MSDSPKPVFRFLNFILFGNIYVALGAVCLIQSTNIQLQLSKYAVAYSFLVFFATLFVYNFQRFFYEPQLDKALTSIRRKWIFENQTTVKVLTFIGFVGVSVAYYFNDYNIIYYLSPLLILSLAYFVSFLKLRKNPVFKLLTLTIVWTMVTAVLPVLMNGGDAFADTSLVHFALRFCFMLAICIPFDIRDLQVDVADEVYTLPHVIGEKNARWLAFAFMLAYMAFVILEYNWALIDLKIAVALLLSAIVNTVPILMSNPKRDEYFYVAWIDGTMILQGLAIIVATVFL